MSTGPHRAPVIDKARADVASGAVVPRDCRFFVVRSGEKFFRVAVPLGPVWEEAYFEDVVVKPEAVAT